MELVTFEERENQPCRMCNCIMERHFPSPKPLTASFPDGMKRPGWADVKEISKLKMEQSRHSVTTQKGREARERIRAQMKGLGASAEKQILDKQPGLEVISDKVGASGVKAGDNK